MRSPIRLLPPKPDMAPDPPAKRVLLNLALLTGSVLLTFGLAEGLLRAFPGLLPEEAALRIHWLEGRTQKVSTIRDSYLGFLYPPDFRDETGRDDARFSFTTDAKGFRNAGAWPTAADIVVVGDSWTFGYGVEDEGAWVAQLDRRLPEVEVVNLGLIGAAPQQYVRIYETFGMALEPKLLIFGLFPGNDIYDAQQFKRWVAAGSPGNYGVWRFFEGGIPVRRQLLERSYLLQLLRSVWKGRRSPFSGETIVLPDGNRLRLAPGVLAGSVEDAQPDDPDFQLVMTAIEQAGNLTQRTGAAFLVLLYPTKEEVYLPLLGEPTPHLVQPFARELERRGIPFLDLTGPLQERAQAGEALYFEVDGHANTRGNEVIAGAVLEHLEKNAGEYSLPGWEAEPPQAAVGT